MLKRKDTNSSNKGVKTLLFFANWLFIVFLSKWFLSPPQGEFSFLVKNLGSFLVAVVMTFLMAQFTSRKGMFILITTMLMLALVIAVI